MTPEADHSRRQHHHLRTAPAGSWLGAAAGLLLLLAVPSAVVGQPVEPLVLTSGVVKSVDPARGIVTLESGWTLRVRSVMVDGRLVNVSAVRVADLVFVSGAAIEAPSDHASAAPVTRR